MSSKDDEVADAAMAILFLAMSSAPAPNCTTTEVREGECSSQEAGKE